MKQPLILTAEQREACARALVVRDVPAFARNSKSLDWAIGLVRRAETYLAIVHARARISACHELDSVAILLAVQGHALLLDFIKAAGWLHAAARILADVAFGPDLNPEPAPASE